MAEQTAPTAANYVFLPWVRQGVAAGIQTADSLGGAQAGVVSVTVTLRVNDTVDLPRQVRLYGPGDVTGIDPQQVIRTVPHHQAMDFEPNFFPAIEFDRPDFPWLFTPAKADTEGKLRPWLCLVVVRQLDGVTLRVGSGLPLPVLTIAQPERELPDLAESWAWAHAQIAGSPLDRASLQAALAGDPALTLSRLVCPRRLDPLTAYLACVVPAFELGRLAGLGMPITSDDEKVLQPAWSSEAQVTLPVYFHWEFRTGTGGDFEALAQALTARPLPSEVGRRPMDISRSGLDIPLPADTPLEFEGALRVKGATTAAWPADTRTPFQTALTPILNAPWAARQQEGHAPLLAPPIYGSWQAAQSTVAMPPAPPAPPPSPLWLHTLNLDPRHRAVAALGTKVIQDQQEQLMAAAWEQLGHDIEQINHVRRQAQLAHAVNAVYHAKHFTRFSDETLLNVVASAQARAVVEVTDDTNRQPRTHALLSARIAQTTLPARAVSAPVRRLTSPRGVLGTRSRTGGASPRGVVTLLSTTTVVASQRKDAGWVTIDQVSDTGVAGPSLTPLVRFERIANALATAPQLGTFQIVAEGGGRAIQTAFNNPTFTEDSPDAHAFRQAATAHQAYLARALPSLPSSPLPPKPSMDLSAMKNTLLHTFNPDRTMQARVEASLSPAAGVQLPSDALAPIMEAPEFPQPMYEALRDLAPEFLFFGLESVPQDTVTLLETNTAFVEAFLVGLNAEMSRELLWRNYPTDQRGTYFRRFWDTSVGNNAPNIAMIHQWGDRPLGENASTGEQLVLLLRGELLRRYPNAVIYAVRAERKDGKLELSPKSEDERHPLFRGTLPPDVTFLGFQLTREDALAGDGWFFVIQQQPTEPTFGLDVANFAKPLPDLTAPEATWNNLSWRHLADTEEALQALSHISIKKSALPTPPMEKATWGRHAAHQAYITLQHPVRIAIHASTILPPD